jgi:hypothetical protein
MEEGEKQERKKSVKGRVKRKFKMPNKPAMAVKALWESASPEDREKAHQTAAMVLEYWMGRVGKVDAAQKLGVPPLRVWQLSQQALSGMAAALVKQPRSGKKKLREMLPPEENPKVLTKRIQSLERDLALTQELVKLLRDLPGNREVLKKSEGVGGKKKKVQEGSPADGSAVVEVKETGPGGPISRLFTSH